MADSVRCGERIGWVWRMIGHQLSIWTPSYLAQLDGSLLAAFPAWVLVSV